MPNCRSTSTEFSINLNITQNGLLRVNAKPHDLKYKLEDVFEISVGPRDKYDGIKSCLTYNPPGSSKPGYQEDRSVRFYVLPYERSFMFSSIFIPSYVLRFIPRQEITQQCLVNGLLMFMSVVTSSIILCTTLGMLHLIHS